MQPSRMDDPVELESQACSSRPICGRELWQESASAARTHLGWIQAGGQIEERFTLSNTSSLPASWVQINDRSTLPEFNANRSTSISAGYLDQWSLTATCNQRGLFYLGGAIVRQVTRSEFSKSPFTIHNGPHCWSCPSSRSARDHDRAIRRLRGMAVRAATRLTKQSRSHGARIFITATARA